MRQTDGKHRNRQKKKIPLSERKTSSEEMGKGIKEVIRKREEGRSNEDFYRR